MFFLAAQSGVPPMNKLPPTSVIVEAPSVDSADQVSKPLADSPRERLGLRSHDQLFGSAFVAIVLLLTMVQWLRLSGWNQQPIEIERMADRKYDFRININTAGWVEWTQIEGIGETTARRIVADRDERGPFRSLSDLGRVKGIGNKTLARLKPYLREGTIGAEGGEEMSRSQGSLPQNLSRTDARR